MRSRARIAAAGAVVAIVATAAPGAAQGATRAQAAQSGGVAVLQVGGPAAKALKRADVRFAPRRAQLSLPVTRSTVGTAASVRLRGSLTLRKDERRAALRGLRLTLKPRSARLTATLSGRRLTLAAGRPRAARLTLDRGTGRVTLSATTLRIAKPAARRLARRLALDRPPRGRLARLSVGIPGSTGSGGGAPGGIPSGPGAPSGPGPGPGGDGLPRLARPDTAVPITSSAITWHVRDSFIQYMNTGEGATARDGATADPPREGCGNSTPFVYDFHFPFTEGWYDPPSGKAALYHSGGVNFSFEAHGIDITASAPEIEINGADSRAIFRIKDADADKRGVLANMKPIGTPFPKQCAADPGPTGAANPQTAGSTRTYERMRGEVPEGADESVFAGFYLPGDDFGWFSVTFATP